MTTGRRGPAAAVLVRPTTGARHVTSVHTNTPLHANEPRITDLFFVIGLHSENILSIFTLFNVGLWLNR